MWSRAPLWLYWCVCMHGCVGRFKRLTCLPVWANAFIFHSHAIFILVDPRLNQHAKKRFIIIFIKVYKFSHEQHNKTAANGVQIYAFGEFVTKTEFTFYLVPVSFSLFVRFWLLFCALYYLRVYVLIIFLPCVLCCSRHSHYINGMARLMCCSQHISGTAIITQTKWTAFLSLSLFFSLILHRFSFCISLYLVSYT